MWKFFIVAVRVKNEMSFNWVRVVLWEVSLVALCRKNWRAQVASRKETEGVQSGNRIGVHKLAQGLAQCSQ